MAVPTSLVAHGLELHLSTWLAYLEFVNGGYYTENELLGIIEAKPAVHGDVNGDGVVTAYDITALYNILLGNSHDYEENADITGDGNITAADITAIYDILLGNK